MRDTKAVPGLPAEIPMHSRRDRVRIRLALNVLDPTRWYFAVKSDLLIGVRRWPGVGVDRLAVVGPDLVVARRDVLPGGHLWDAQGTVEEMVDAVTALGPPQAETR